MKTTTTATARRFVRSLGLATPAALVAWCAMTAHQAGSATRRLVAMSVLANGHGEHGGSRAARKPRPWLASRLQRRLWRVKIEPWCVHVVGLLTIVAEIETKCFSQLKEWLLWLLVGSKS